MPKTSFLLTALVLWWLWLWRRGHTALPAAGAAAGGVPPAVLLPPPSPGASPGIVPVLPWPSGWNLPGSVVSP